MNQQQSLQQTLSNIRDLANEAVHRSTAEAEGFYRAISRDEMTLSQRVVSSTNEARNRLQVKLDRAKREARHTF